MSLEAGGNALFIRARNSPNYFLTATDDSSGSKIESQERDLDRLQSWILKKISDSKYAICCLTRGADFLAITCNDEGKDYTLTTYDKTSNSQQFSINISNSIAIFTDKNGKSASTSNSDFKSDDTIGSYDKDIKEWKLIQVYP
ncbi:21280_t:CDS:1 [Cetraspora pellucida]|uniref:21280_t:CDS:1 n=1 Tax=Cetraspora pellucida TaxID=1433469 RepID=A0A9N9JIQ4_9GLOM|nr:21280_t:CDS:1 [Cetraspora pellucida]